MDILSLKKEAKMYNGENAVSSTSHARKTGQLCVKKMKQALSNTIHKNKLKMN